MRKSKLLMVYPGTICWVLSLSSGLLAQASTEIVSVSFEGAEPDAGSLYSAISEDGNFVAFATDATDIISGDVNGFRDVVLWDLDEAGATLISVSTDGTQSDGPSEYPAVSSDGTRVAFESTATNLVTGDTNGVSDVFVRDLTAEGVTILVSADRDGLPGNGPSSAPSISADGRYVAFLSQATNLIAGSADANPGGVDVFLKDTSDGTVVLIDVSDDEVQPTSGSATHVMISGDGRFVVFSTVSLLTPGTQDFNGQDDVFLRDWQAGTTTLVSRGTTARAANGASGYPAVDFAGNRIAFESTASNMVDPPMPTLNRIYVHDVASSTTTLVSKSTGGDLPNGRSYTASVSPDGGFIAFGSVATNLFPLDTNGKEDMFLHDLSTGKTTLISMATDSARGNGDSDSGYFILPRDAMVIAFRSRSTNFVEGETTTTGRPHVYVRWRADDTTPPDISCSANTDAECSAPSGTIVESTNTASDDLDPAPALECDEPAANAFPLGKTVVTCTATDNEGNVSTCSFEVNVADTTPPSIVTPGPVSVFCTSPAGALADFTVSALDGCDANVALTVNPPSGSLFPVGTTTVTATATDASGLVATSTFDVSVVKEVPVFLRGDSNSDARADIADAIFTLLYLFAGRRVPPCLDAADADDTGEVDMTDAIYFLQYLFQAGPAIPAPGVDVTGPDPTEDSLGCGEPKC